MWYGFYSRKQEDLFTRVKGLDGRHPKVIIWQLATGGEARCTQVSANPDYHSTFDDLQRLGEVTKFLRQEIPIALPTNHVE